MSQKMQQHPRMGAGLQGLPAVCEDDPQAEVDTLKIVACPVCRAVYMPAGEQPGQLELAALEAAFLDVCRYCFRCQRPACPQCWNPVHHTCAACSEEARLPFRSPVPALEGLVFWPASTVQADPASKISFICQRNGRFYASEPAPACPESPQEAAISPTVISDALPALQPDDTDSALAPSEAYPTWLQEVLSPKAQGLSTPPLVTGKAPGNPLSMRPSVAPPVAWLQTSQAYWPQMAPATYAPVSSVIPPLATYASAPVQPGAAFPPRVAPIQTGQIQPVAQHEQHVVESQGEPQSQDDMAHEEFSLFERIENALIVITSILLLVVVLAIILALSFVQVNTFFLNLLHIDIRTEIAYLLQLK